MSSGKTPPLCCIHHDNTCYTSMASRNNEYCKSVPFKITKLQSPFRCFPIFFFLSSRQSPAAIGLVRRDRGCFKNRAPFWNSPVFFFSGLLTTEPLALMASSGSVTHPVSPASSGSESSRESVVTGRRLISRHIWFIVLESLSGLEAQARVPTGCGSGSLSRSC